MKIDPLLSIPPALLKTFTPFKDCTEEELIIIADNSRLSSVKKGDFILQAGSSDEWDYFLVEGELKLIADDGKEQRIISGTEKCKQAVAHLQPRHYTVVAMKPTEYLQVKISLLENLHSEDTDEEGSLETGFISGLPMDNPLYLDIYDDMINDRLDLPSIPEVALRVREMIDRDDSTIEGIAEVIQTDPAISAKLIKAANSALYHGQPRVESCVRATSRLGLLTTQHLVVSFVLRNMFSNKIKSPLLVERARRLWQHSVEVGAISQILARQTPGIDPDQALLAGLLHDIGELIIISYAEKNVDYATNEGALDHLVGELKSKLGEFVLREWHFSDSFVTVAKECEQWGRDSGKKADYCDVVLVAQLQSMAENSNLESLPDLTAVPAYAKLGDSGLSPGLSGTIIDDAMHAISETKALLLH